jgi:hypothetical protein
VYICIHHPYSEYVLDCLFGDRFDVAVSRSNKPNKLNLIRIERLLLIGLQTRILMVIGFATGYL